VSPVQLCTMPVESSLIIALYLLNDSAVCRQYGTDFMVIVYRTFCTCFWEIVNYFVDRLLTTSRGRSVHHFADSIVYTVSLSFFI